MDKQIRKLERSGDPELIKRAAQLRCKVEGCVSRVIDRIEAVTSPTEMRTNLVIVFSDGETMDTFISDHEILKADFESIRNRMAETALKMACCRRCGKDTERSEYYLRVMQDKLGGLLT